MALKKTMGIALIAAAAGAAGAVAWLHVRSGEPQGMAAQAGSPPIANELPATNNAPAAAPPASDLKEKNVKPDTSPKDETPEGPLRAGEEWDFTANVSKLSNVANIQVRVLDRGHFLGKTAWHLRASAHTENPLRIVFSLDDQFDSYSDASALTSLQYEMHLNERGEKIDSVQRMTIGGRAPADATATIVLPGTRDPLGMLAYLRAFDWTKSPEVRSPVYDGHKLYDVRARLAANAEKITVPAGSYASSKIELRVFEGGVETKDSHFFLYLANDSRRTPVLLDAQLPFAEARVELLRFR